VTGSPEVEPLDFAECAQVWRRKAEQHWKRSKEFDAQAVEERRLAERADANAAMFERLVQE
jgi:hypothetical protein